MTNMEESQSCGDWAKQRPINEPIGYVVWFRRSKGAEWEPMALTACTQSDQPQPPLLLRRSCLTMFSTESEAERQMRRLMGQPWTRNCECRFVAVFSEAGAAPHRKES